nr:hypothetical protein [Syntrophothermus sp.]
MKRRAMVCPTFGSITPRPRAGEGQGRARSRQSVIPSQTLLMRL